MLNPRWAAWLSFLGSTVVPSVAIECGPNGYRVQPGESIQEAIEAAGLNPTNKVVRVQAGVYRPREPAFALIWFHHRHNGVKVFADGAVTLSAENETVARPGQAGYPALVNHVVYFGDGLSARTVLEGFRIMGANHFVMTNRHEAIEPNTKLVKGLFFFADGGAIKIFGRSYPTLRRLEIVENYASPCAGGISVEHEAAGQLGSRYVRIEDCVFQNNRAQVTGAAVDLLPGSFAVISNCLFVGNLPNTGVNYIDPNRDRPAFTNSAALTVFQGSGVAVWRSTFTGNRNGVDHFGEMSVFEDCIFWRNTRPGGHYTESRYELDLQGPARVRGCFLGGDVRDPLQQVSASANRFPAADPEFDKHFVPAGAGYENAGYRPWRSETLSR